MLDFEKCYDFVVLGRNRVFENTRYRPKITFEFKIEQEDRKFWTIELVWAGKWLEKTKNQFQTHSWAAIG